MMGAMGDGATGETRRTEGDTRDTHRGYGFMVHTHVKTPSCILYTHFILCLNKAVT